MIVSAAKAIEAAEVLGVELERLTPSALKRAYRTKTKDCHPDHHGNARLQEWARVSWAKECLGFWLEKHPSAQEEAPEIQGTGDCRACNGTGRVVMAKRGWGAALTAWCVVCDGLGTVMPREDDGD
jgi:DnaJ-class molecular chaperone